MAGPQFLDPISLIGDGAKSFRGRRWRSDGRGVFEMGHGSEQCTSTEREAVDRAVPLWYAVLACYHS